MISKASDMLKLSFADVSMYSILYPSAICCPISFVTAGSGMSYLLPTRMIGVFSLGQFWYML